METFTEGEEVYGFLSSGSRDIEKLKIVKVSPKQIQVKVWSHYSNKYVSTFTLRGLAMEKIYKTESEAKHRLAQQKEDQAEVFENRARELREEAKALKGGT